MLESMHASISEGIYISIRVSTCMKAYSGHALYTCIMYTIVRMYVFKHIIKYA